MIEEDYPSVQNVQEEYHRPRSRRLVDPEMMSHRPRQPRTASDCFHKCQCMCWIILALIAVNIVLIAITFLIFYIESTK